MFSLSLFQCWSCRYPLDPQTHGSLCRVCLMSLGPPPQLCQTCGGLIPYLNCTLKECQRPWLELKTLRGYSSFYQVTGSNYELFKRWKKAGFARSINSILLRDLTFNEKSLKIEQKILIPIPHTYTREWTLHGSTSERLAREISRRSRIPVMKILGKPRQEIRQAQKSGSNRWEDLPKFELHETNSLEKNQTLAVIVDDFKTSGSTVFSAAKTLSSGGWKNIWIHHLAVRS